MFPLMQISFVILKSQLKVYWLGCRCLLLTCLDKAIQFSAIKRFRRPRNLNFPAYHLDFEQTSCCLQTKKKNVVLMWSPFQKKNFFLNF